MSKKILITGGAGFVGSALAIKLKSNYPQYEVVVLDNLKRRGSELNIGKLTEQGVSFHHGDIRNSSDFNELGFDFTAIIEASAEPSVLAGLNSAPDYLVDTNLMGTIHCLNFARKCKADFIFLSTSRVYPVERLNSIEVIEQQTRFALAQHQQQHGVSVDGISEQFDLLGYRSLYGATKLASELLLQEYNHFYQMRTVVNRCGVLTGPGQMGKVDQGVVVLWMAKHFWKGKLSYIGFGGLGKQVRDMLHTNDLFRLIDFQLHNMNKVNGQVYNVGGGNAVSSSLLELTSLCTEITGNKIVVESVPENRQADIILYVTDNKKVTHETGWTPQISVQEILSEIHDWILTNERTLKPFLQ